VILRIFGTSFALTIAALVAAWFLGGFSAVLIVGILIVLEVSLSFDNAVVNASVLDRMDARWQKLFLTVGLLIAVVGMRLVAPLVLVGVTAHISPVKAVDLAVKGGSIDEPGTYAYLLHHAHPAIAAFGGMFLLLLFLDFVFTDRDHSWLAFIERPLIRVGRLKYASVAIALAALLITARTLADEPETVLISGLIGTITYLLMGGLGEFFGDPSEADTSKVSGRAAFFLFCYLNVLDASFSLDGVVGAFAISQDIFIIALGLGVGAMYIRSLTVFMVRQGTLSEYIYLEHGAHWAIGALATILLISIKYAIPEVVTGLIGVVFIGLAYWSSIRHRKRAVAVA
jgi:hypothetical protein